MDNYAPHIVLMLLPLILTNVLHMAVVKKNYFSILNTPIWQSGFGTNKTWRGIFFISAGNALFLVVCARLFAVDEPSPLWLGFLLGATYSLSELPNSFLKRKLGVASGGHHPKYKYIFYVLDKMDSSFGVAVVYSLYSGITMQTAAMLLLINISTHMILSLLLFKLHIKSGF